MKISRMTKVVSLGLGFMILIAGCSGSNDSPPAPTSAQATLSDGQLKFTPANVDASLKLLNDVSPDSKTQADAVSTVLVAKDKKATIVLFSSSSCPIIPTSVDLSKQVMTVSVEGSDINKMCTKDLRPTAWTVILPETVDKVTKAEIRVPKVFSDSPDRVLDSTNSDTAELALIWES